MTSNELNYFEIEDGEFREPRLAQVYDYLDPQRLDLRAYESIVADEFKASSVLDVGSGTGTLALRFANAGLRAIGVDPARASVDRARSKPGGEAVTWFEGTVADLPDLTVDAVTMSANVAQVFLSDEEFSDVLHAIAGFLAPGGVAVFEARRIEDRAWERWTPEHTYKTTDIPGSGKVETWVDLRSVNGDQTTHTVTVVFCANGTRYDSVSTLRFRTRDAIELAIHNAGLTIFDVRDLPYAPGRGWLYIATKPATPTGLP